MSWGTARLPQVRRSVRISQARRARIAHAKKVEPMSVGMFDPMSAAAQQCLIETCHACSPGGFRCTRAAGHWQGQRHEPQGQHVVVSPRGIVVEVW